MGDINMLHIFLIVIFFVILILICKHDEITSRIRRNSHEVILPLHTNNDTEVPPKYEDINN